MKKGSQRGYQAGRDLLECCGRIQFDSWNNARYELEEHNEIEIHPHSVRIIICTVRRLWLLAPSNFADHTKPLLLPGLASFAGGTRRIRSMLTLFYHASIHSFDYFLHDTGVLAGVHRYGRESSGVREWLDRHSFECVVRGDVLENLGLRERITGLDGMG
jgi:hypothetical protein